MSLQNQILLSSIKPGTKILFATVPADGHVNPLTGLAYHLKSEGYDVRVAGVWSTLPTASVRVTLASRSDFTSLPRSMIPHSHVSRIS